MTRQSVGRSGNKKHHLFFPQHFRYKRILCVTDRADLQEGTSLTPAFKTSSEVVRRTHLPTSLKWQQSNCLRHLLFAGHCISCCAARVEGGILLCRYYLNICNTFSTPVWRDALEAGWGALSKKCVWFWIPAGKYVISWAEVIKAWWWIYVEQVHVFVELLHVIAERYILLCRTVLVRSYSTVKVPTCSILIAIALQR